jgi:hypothetical protein
MTAVCVLSLDRRKLVPGDGTEQWRYDGPTILKKFDDYLSTYYVGDILRRAKLPDGVTRFIVYADVRSSCDYWGEWGEWVEDFELVPLQVQETSNGTPKTKPL